MAQTITIPLQSTASTSRVTLGGKVFDIKFVWMFRTGNWNIYVNDANGLPIIEGISLQTDQAITRRYPDVVASMKGELWMINNPESIQRVITKTNVNTDFSLIYISTEELEV